MAGVPCVNDSCSVVATVDANGRLNLNARLDPDGGLVCTDGQGLGVQISGAPAPIADGAVTCGNLLGVTTTGNLFARRPAHAVLEAGMASRASLLQSTSHSAPLNITNNTGCNILVVADLKFDFRFQYTTAGTALADRYYSFDITYDFQVGGTSVLAGDQFSETLSGVGPSADSDFRTFARHATGIFTAGPGITSVALIATRSANGGDTVGTITATGGTTGLIMGARLAVLESNSGAAVTFA